MVSDYDLTYTLRSTGTYMEDQKERKELAITSYEDRQGIIESWDYCLSLIAM